MVGGGVGGGEKRRPCGKRRDLHQAPFSSLEAFATPSTPAVLHPQPLCCPAPPSSDGVRSPPSPRRLRTPRAKAGAPERPRGEAGPHAPPLEPRPPLHCPGGTPVPSPRLLEPSRAPPPKAGAPAAAEPLPGADFWRGGACSARRAGSGPEEGMGDGGGVRGGRGRDGGGQAAPPFPAAAADRRAEGRSAPGPAAGVGASPGQGVRGVGAGSRVLTLRSCSQRAQCSLACD